MNAYTSTALSTLAVMFLATIGVGAQAATLLPGSIVSLAVSSDPFDAFSPSLSDTNSPTAQVIVGDPSSEASLFLDGNRDPAEVVEDYNIFAQATRLFVDSSGGGTGNGDQGDVLIVSGLQFDSNHVLAGITITALDTNSALPLLVAGSLTGDGFTLDISPLSSFTFGADFEVTFQATAIPLPGAAWMLLAGLGALAAIRQSKHS